MNLPRLIILTFNLCLIFKYVLSQYKFVTLCGNDFQRGEARIDDCQSGYVAKFKSRSERYMSTCYPSRCINDVSTALCTGFGGCVIQIEYRSRIVFCDNSVRIRYECVAAIDIVTTTTTTTQTSLTNTAQKDQNDSDDSSAIIITVTVILCVAIIGVGILVGVYIYRHPMTKLNEIFRASRGLRRRPEVERNIYSATHTGLRASEVPPPTPSPNTFFRSGNRSITAMRLPAIPPDEVDNAINMTPPQPPRVEHAVRPPAPLPREDSPPSPEVDTATHGVQLPTPVTSNPNNEDSDSDDDDDDDLEYIPDHRFSMVHRAKVQNTSGDLKSDEVKADGEKLENVDVDVVKDEPIHGTIAEVKRQRDGACNIHGGEDKNVENRAIDKDKTLSLTQTHAAKKDNENDIENPTKPEEVSHL